MIRRHAVVLWLGMFAAVGVVGCERVADHQKGTVPVGGVVTLAGSPVAGATVVFVAEASGRSASAITDAAGRYTLMTFRRGDGALPGKYGVTVAKFQAGAAPNESEKYVPPQGPVPPPKNDLPMKYSVEKTSGLSATVEVGATNVFDFALVP